ncbi:MAG TPA: PIN domain-containing protein [Candidatus Paceibacterota bacterium]|nr:PIN domain-containing protein [Candidatus Paceibacterota bacterium]
MPHSSLLDASALVALVLRENGWRTVDAIVDSGLALTTPNTLAETFEICRQKKTGISQDEILQLLKLKNVQVVPLVEEDAVEAGYIYKKAAEHNSRSLAQIHISLVDVTLLAVGKRLNAIVVFSDNAWKLIDLPGIEVRPFR